jgi:hypothetical protein
VVVDVANHRPGTGRDDGMIGHVAHRFRRLTQQQRVIIVVTFRHVTRKIRVIWYGADEFRM